MGINGKMTEYGVLLAVIFVLGLVVESPRVVRQFIGLTKTGDIVWNVAYDLLILTAAAVVFLIVDELLNYLKRKFK
ncbi:MAG: hypothetical protein IJ904_07425 [Candidatus Methanomethylophilaceae archaeon]|nr:hypothetical protein [Candidatus Methanomethylophilaceae archaeon]